MLNKFGTYMAIAAACMLTLSACSSDDALSIADAEKTDKTPIEVTVGIVGEGSSGVTRGVTRTVTLDNNDNNKALAFGKGTSLYMVIKSEDASDANATYTRTIGYAQTEVNAYNTKVEFATNYVRYWEDSHSRDSRVSLYAACVPGYYYADSKPSAITANGTTDATKWTVGSDNSYNTSYANTWNTGYSSTTITWPLRSASVANQTATNGFVDNQDLCFSNNVAYPIGGTDSRIIFDGTEKKFKSGRMVFYHALTKITFKIKKGEGFESTDAFAFTNSNENIVLKGFNTTGTFDITTGEFTSSSNATAIKELAVDAIDGDYVHVLHGLMLPGSALTSTATDEVYFTIDKNLYHITKEQLKIALDGKKLSDNTTDALADGSTMRPGVHYIFTMTVGKQKVDKLTAAVVPWETVEAEETTPTNARISVSLLDNGTKQTDTQTAFNLYRLADNNTSGTINDGYIAYNWDASYETTPATLTWQGTSGDASGHWKTNWFWPDNNSFYHFRTVAPTTVGVNAKTADTAGDYLTLTAASSYTDVCWGAPFYHTTDKLYYDPTTNGFALKKNSTTDYQISKAIGPTTGTINLEMFHMMSDVTVKLTTSTGDDAVTLAGSTVSFSNTVTTGTVLMGTGRVIPGSTISTAANGAVTQIESTSVYQWHYGFIPQSLANVVLTITTADNNQYKINMWEVIAPVTENLIANPYTESSTSGKYTINSWYPNYKYIYNFKLTKTGIEKITATLANWESVEATDDNVQIQ